MQTAHIVQLLNQPPFSKDLSLVAFDEMSSYDLLSLINSIFIHLDKKHKVDLRDEPHEQMIARMLDFIKLMKFPIKGSEADFMNQLVMGNHGAVYPLLHYFLDKRPSLEKRAYLAPFLVPIDVPAQYMVDNTVNGVYQSYRGLQQEFSTVHKQYDQLRSTTMAPKELQKEIKQLSDEREQLKDKISSMKVKTEDMRGFEKIHAITSGLRKEQEEESRLDERRADQMAQLQATEHRYEQIARALIELKQNIKSTGNSPEDILKKQRDAVYALKEIVSQQLPKEIEHQQVRLRKMDAQLHEPVKSQDEVDRMHDHVRQLKNEIGRLERDIDASSSKNSDDNLGMFRKQAALIAKKLEQKQSQMDSANDAREKLQNKLDDLQAQAAAMGGVTMPKGQDFKSYAKSLREKTTKYRSMKKKINIIQSESVILHRTESILKSRCQNLSEVMATIEKKKGVQGYTSTEKTLEQISSATAALNQTKGKTLEEISLIVTDINSTLNLRKNKLAPQIKKLREVRSEYQEIDAIYQDKKTMFEHTAAGLSAERQRLENECNRYLQEATSQESQYFMVHSLNELEQVKSDKYEMESKFNKGDGALLPDFKTFESFYRHKIELQQTLNQQMRKHHNGMAASAPEDGRQRRIFTVLMTLLNGKKNSLMNGGNIPGDEHGAATAIIDEYGGTNIMTLQQED